MSTRTKWIGLVCTALVACLLAPVAAQEGPTAEGERDEKSAREEFARTGPEHAAWQKLAGNWSCEIRCWSDEDAVPEISKGEARYTTVLGGRFLKEEFAGTVHEAPVQGIGYLGYDRSSGKFESTWMDTMGTGMLHLTGSENIQGKEWTLEGVHAGPDRRIVRCRVVFRQIDADHRVMELHRDRGRGEFKAMEIEYMRRK